MATVNCKTHGIQPETLVCQHIVEGLIARQRVGFFWSTENSANPRPDACCSACNDRVKVSGGAWVGETLEKANPQVLCGCCYDAAKQFHMGGNPWS